VGAFGAGAARGAFERALEFACGTTIGDARLVDHEWAQSTLAEMYQNAAMSRLAYVEANYANSLHGLFRYLVAKPVYYFLKWTPAFFLRNAIGPLLDRPFATRLARRLHFGERTRRDGLRASGWGSLAKLVGSDAAVRNCQLAVRLMGHAGVRRDHGVEKCLRDAKLLQIYEGTNQLNRLNLFKCLIADRAPDARLFGRSR
jgi:alkylation response protein AidB-like acyl-CoA dehydrogenase